MKWFLLLTGILLSSRPHAGAEDVPEMSLDDRQMEMLIKTYPNFFVRKREEQKAFIQRMLDDGDYEKRYKMFDMAFKNILKMFEVEEEKAEKIQHRDGVLPSKADEFKTVITVLENTCLVGEIVLHFPELAYRILETHTNWRERVEFGRRIAKQYEFVYDQLTKEMLELFNQEINPDQRTEDFVNPYAEAAPEKVDKKKNKKKKEKKPKGPSLQEL